MSKDILVFIEQRDGVIQNVSFELCGAAKELASKVEGAKVCAAVIGEHAGKLAKELQNSGADKVYFVEDSCLKHYLNETYTKAFEEVVKVVEPNVVLIGASSIGRDLAPRLSARINTGLTADCTKLEMDSEGKIDLDEMMTYTSKYYNTGSGTLKKKSFNTKYDVRTLSKYSIVHSDDAKDEYMSTLRIWCLRRHSQMA